MDLINNCTRSRGKLNRNSYCSWSHSNSTHSNQWMERKRRRWSVGGIWVSGGCWEGIGDGLSMYVLVLFLCLWYCACCVYLILTFQVIMLSSCLEYVWRPIDSVSANRPIMIIVVFAFYDEKITGSGLTIFNGAYPVRYECHESTVWVELQQVLFGIMDCKERQE